MESWRASSKTTPQSPSRPTRGRRPGGGHDRSLTTSPSPTGASKATIARLAARFHDPTMGNVRRDGIDSRELALSDLGRAARTVTHGRLLLRGPVADNIGLAPGALR